MSGVPRDRRTPVITARTVINLHCRECCVSVTEDSAMEEGGPGRHRATAEQPCSKYFTVYLLFVICRINGPAMDSCISCSVFRLHDLALI